MLVELRRPTRPSEKSTSCKQLRCSFQDCGLPDQAARPRRRNALDPKPGCSLQETARGAWHPSPVASAGCARPRLHAIAGKSSGNRDGSRAISSGYRLRLGRIPGRCRFCGDDIRRAAGAGIAVDCRRSGQGGTWRARMTDGRSGNNGKDAARRESSETGLRIDLLRKPDCCAALQPCWNSLRI